MQGSGSTAVPGSLLLAAGLWPTYQYRLFPGQLLEASLLPGDEEAGITRRSWGLTPSSSWPNRDGGNFIHNIQKQGPGWIQNDYVGTGHRQEAHLPRASRDSKHQLSGSKTTAWPQGSQPLPLENQFPHNTQQSPKEEPSRRSTHPCSAFNIQTRLNTDHKGPPKKRQPHTGVAQGLLQNQIQGLISLAMLNPPCPPAQGIPACSQGAEESWLRCLETPRRGREDVYHRLGDCPQLWGQLSENLSSPHLFQSNAASARHQLLLVTCAWTKHIIVTSGLCSHLYNGHLCCTSPQRVRLRVKRDNSQSHLGTG